MLKSIAATLLAASALLLGCSEEYLPKDYLIGPNGEPPKALKKVYTKKFLAERKNYVRALGEIHAFSIENEFFPVTNYECFGNVLDIKVTASTEKYKRAFPCVVVHASRGAEHTNAYLRVWIDEVKFNQLDHDNRLIYKVEIFGGENLNDAFASTAEPNLLKLYSTKPERAPKLPHNSSLNHDLQQDNAAPRHWL